MSNPSEIERKRLEASELDREVTEAVNKTARRYLKNLPMVDTPHDLITPEFQHSVQERDALWNDVIKAIDAPVADFLIVDDPVSEEPLTPGQIAETAAWFEKTITPPKELRRWSSENPSRISIPKKLEALPEVTMVAAYDPWAYEDLIDEAVRRTVEAIEKEDIEGLGVIREVYLSDFRPSDMIEGEAPEMEVTIDLAGKESVLEEDQKRFVGNATTLPKSEWIEWDVSACDENMLKRAEEIGHQVAEVIEQMVIGKDVDADPPILTQAMHDHLHHVKGYINFPPASRGQQHRELIGNIVQGVIDSKRLSHHIFSIPLSPEVEKAIKALDITTIQWEEGGGKVIVPGKWLETFIGCDGPYPLDPPLPDNMRFLDHAPLIVQGENNDRNPGKEDS